MWQCELLLCTALYCLLHCSYYVQSTEITEASPIIDDSLGFHVELPVLVCHAKHTGYKEVTWFKDYRVLKNGTSDISSHFLSLAELLYSDALTDLDNPFKLQGYYWCETDHTQASQIHDYLFLVKEIHTFAGRFVAKEDSLGDAENLDIQEKITWKMQIYEEAMEEQLFGFLQYPSVYVTDIKELSKGLEVRFFVYDRLPFQPRKPVDMNLKTDRDSLLYIKDYLRNESTSIDPILYYSIRNWTDLLGIDIEKIDLRSTLGCYSEKYAMTSNESVLVVWPSARIGDVVIPENACSTKDNLAVTRVCTGSFYRGAKWGRPSGECEKPAEGLTSHLKNIHEMFGRIDKTRTIKNLAEEIKLSLKGLGVTDLHITIDILKELSLKPKLDQQEINEILFVIDKILETDKTELIAAKNTIHLTSRILQIFDNLLIQATEEKKEIQISKQNLMVDTKYTKTYDEKNPILGLAVIAPKIHDGLQNGSIVFLKSNSKLPQHESLAHFVLPRELVLKRESEMEDPKIPCQVNMVFFKKWDLFQNPKGVLVKRNYKVLPTPVMYVSLSGGPAWNLTDPVHLYFKDTGNVDIETPVCVYYDRRLEDRTGGWSSEGCRYEGYKNGYYHCECHHLSIFAVILSENPQPDFSQLKLGTSVYVACGASILSLAVAVVLFCLSKNWRQTIDHSILFSLSLCFLVCVIIIFISETHFARKPGCIVLALVLYYTIFTIFGWLLVQAIVYRLRFAKKTDLSEIPHFLIKTGLCIWGIPVVIIVIMWFSREYPCSGKENCWLTVSEVSKEALIPLVVLIVITMGVYACATYTLTGRFKKEFFVGDTVYNDVVVKFRVAFTIFLFFVLTWLFGHFAIHRRTQSLRILFSICITLTAYYLSLFFIFQEVSFWDLCHKCKKNRVEPETKPQPEDVPAIQYQAKSYKSTGDTNKVEK